jgi:hypothetical protein
VPRGAHSSMAAGVVVFTPQILAVPRATFKHELCRFAGQKLSRAATNQNR